MAKHYDTLETRSPADRLLAGYSEEWRGDIDRLFETHAF